MTATISTWAWPSWPPLAMCLTAAWMTTGCASSAPPMANPMPPIPAHLLTPCEPPVAPPDGRLTTLSHALIEAVTAWRLCATRQAALARMSKARWTESE